MKLSIYAKPNSKQQYVEKVDGKTLKVYVKEPAEDGRANDAIEKEVAAYFNISPYQVKIVAGFKSRRKIVEIE